MSAATATKFFIAQKPCKKSHAPIRYVRSGKCVACAKAHSAEFAKNNPTQHAINSIVWFRANPDKIKSYNSEWRKANREKVNAAQRIRDARKRLIIAQSSSNHTADDRAVVFELQNAQCFYCDVPLAYGSGHGDHYIALARGGSDARHNIVIACPPCNLQKRAEHPALFSLRKGFDPNKRPVFWGEQ